MSEANKALEALEKLANTPMEISLADWQKLCGPIHTALTRLSELEPIIQELVEAHKRYDEAYFEDQRLRIDEPFSFKARVAEDTFHSEKQRFLETAANRIAKIGGV